MNTKEQKISDFLGRGKNAARTGRTLANALGVDLRKLTKMIETERRAGTPICANCSTEQDQQGYYLPETEEELKEYCDSLKGRAIEILKTRQAILKRAKDNEQDHTE